MSPTDSPRSYERIIGRVEGQSPGPTVVIVGALHGNEPAGVIAAARVLDALSKPGTPLKGVCMGIVGNLASLRKGQRFHDFDLNRAFTPERISALATTDIEGESPEDKEQRALMTLLEGLHQEATGPIVFLDLHSTSGDSPPFCAMADTLHNRPIAFSLPIPVILGLEESIEGTLMGYLSERGHIAVVVEGGQHESPKTPDYLEAAIWLSLVSAGCLKAKDVEGYAEHRRSLASIGGHLPDVVEIRYRHAITPEDGFTMKPGFKGMEKVSKGELLATNKAGDIRSPAKARMLMPLYQGKGNDGFFLVREVALFWLWLSALLRRLSLEPLLGYLPGVTRDPHSPDCLQVDPSIARYWTLEIFHLFGYRRRLDHDGHLTFTRRRPAPYQGRP